MLKPDYILKKIKEYSKLQRSLCLVVEKKINFLSNDKDSDNEFYSYEDWVISCSDNTGYCSAVNFKTGEGLGWFKDDEDIIHIWSFYKWLYFNLNSVKGFLDENKKKLFNIISILDKQGEIELNTPQTNKKKHSGIIINKIL